MVYYFISLMLYYHNIDSQVFLTEIYDCLYCKLIYDVELFVPFSALDVLSVILCEFNWCWHDFDHFNAGSTFQVAKIKIKTMWHCLLVDYYSIYHFYDNCELCIYDW